MIGDLYFLSIDRARPLPPCPAEQEESEDDQMWAFASGKQILCSQSVMYRLYIYIAYIPFEFEPLCL